MKKLLLLLLPVLSWGRDFPTKMSVPNYATARSVKVCTIYDGGESCGTGMFIGNGLILTENHVVGEFSEPEITISSSGMVMGLVKHVPVAHMVLKYDGTEFQTATLVRSNKQEDLAILRIEDKVNPSIIFNDGFIRGDEVFVIGNPGREDFSVIKTKIKAVILFNKGGKLRNLIAVDSKENQITHGFSGGAILNKNGGVLGFIELCWEDDNICAGISAKDAENFIKEVK